jgi:Mrp family chromosome partitioning ATPase
MSTITNGQTETLVPAPDEISLRPSLQTPNRHAELAESWRCPGAEYYDTLLWRIQSRLDSESRAGFLLGLTSCNRRAGVSTVAANLAIRAADHNLGPVLLADFNFHHPLLHSMLHSTRSMGLTDLIAGRAKLDDCIQSTSLPALSFLPLGDCEPLNRIRLTPEFVESFTAQLRLQYAIVVCDLPEAGQLGPAMFLASALDAALLVVRSQQVRRKWAQQAVRSLSADGVRLLGAVVTDRRRELPDWLECLL